MVVSRYPPSGRSQLTAMAASRYRARPPVTGRHIGRHVMAGLTFGMGPIGMFRFLWQLRFGSYTWFYWSLGVNLILCCDAGHSLEVTRALDM